MQPVGAIVVGLVAQQIGSRYSILLSSIFYCASWLIFYFAENSTMLLIAQGLAALTYTVGPSITYIAEITQPHIRSAVMATANFSITFGSLFTVTLASFMYWRYVAIVNFVFAVIALVAMFFIPNSPHWLASTIFITVNAKLSNFDFNYSQKLVFNNDMLYL